MQWTHELFDLQIRSNEENEHHDGLCPHVERDDVRRDTCDLRDSGGPSNRNRRRGAESSRRVHAPWIRERDLVREVGTDWRGRDKEAEEAKRKRVQVKRVTA